MMRNFSMMPRGGGDGPHMMVFGGGGGRGGGGKGAKSKEDGFNLRMVFGAFSSLPRVLQLVWSTNAFYTLCLAIITVIRGFAPAASAWDTKLVIDSVIASLPPKNGPVMDVVWLVLLQL